MILPLNKRKIIYILFIVALLILLANLVFTKFYPVKTGGETLGLAESEIDSTFRRVLNNLGVKDEWIKEKNEDMLFLSIRIPKDLPAVLILREINDLFDTSRIKVKSVEKKIGGSTTIYIASGGEDKLKADLIYSDKIKRKTVRAGFIISYTGTSNETDQRLLEYPEQFAFLLIPSAKSGELVKQVISNGKEYIIYLNDEIDELEFKLSEDYSSARNKNSIREIVGTYPGALFFMIDNNSSLYNSDVYPLLKDELEKRKIKLIEESRFVRLSYGAGENTPGFNTALDNLSGGEDEVFIISAQDFFQLGYEIIRYRKLGYRFTSPSALMD